MKTDSVADMQSQFSAFLKSSAAGPVVVTRKGRPVAVLIGMEDEDEIERLLMAYSPQLQAILGKSRQQIRDGQCLSHEDFWAQFHVEQPSKRKPGIRAKAPKKHAPTNRRSSTTK